MSVNHMEYWVGPCRLTASAIRCEKCECGIRGFFAVSCYQSRLTSINARLRNVHFPFDGSDVVRHAHCIENRGTLRKAFKQ
jgi:hypothetical protein